MTPFATMLLLALPILFSARLGAIASMLIVWHPVVNGLVTLLSIKAYRRYRLEFRSAPQFSSISLKPRWQC